MRRTHQWEARENFQASKRVHVYIPDKMRVFFEVEAKKHSEKYGKRVTVSDLFRALVTAYYEKKMAGLICDIHD